MWVRLPGHRPENLVKSCKIVAESDHHVLEDDPRKLLDNETASPLGQLFPGRRVLVDGQVLGLQIAELVLDLPVDHQRKPRDQ